MKNTVGWISFFILGLMGSLMAQEPSDTSPKATKETKAPSKATLIKEFSYSYGYSFAKDLKEKSTFAANEMGAKELLKGLKDGMKCDTAKLGRINKYLDERLNSQTPAETDEAGKNTAYNLGYNAIANMMTLLEVPKTDFHYGSIKKGYMDFTNGKASNLTETVMNEKLNTYFQVKQAAVQEKALAKRKEEAAKNLALGQKFLEENAKKEGIKMTASGLQYQVIKEGEGERPTLNSRVVTHYTGTLMNGKVFDSSIERGQPATFPLNAVIQGWQEGIPLMTKGSRYRLFVPAVLGYGENSPSSIPPNSVLIFDVELIDVMEEDAATTNAKGQLSYSYGYMIGKSLERVEFSANEKSPNQFVQGFAKGFEATDQDIAVIESLLKARMEAGEPATDPEAAKKIAFGIGFSSAAGIATQIGALSADFDFNAVGVGYSSALKGEDSQFSDEEMNAFLKSYFEPKQQALKSKMETEQQASSMANIAAGAAFLKENAKKEGVVTMSNGMQYVILEAGAEDDVRASLEDKVTTHYHGTLIDGTVFDSSVDRGEPATFPLNGVIQGWQEGIPLMPVGSKYRFFIPSNLAYGNRAMGASIAPGSTLIFEVELIKIN
ncbi:MAG: FKBP-type peptidyl-prolyl cis-trans isomerase FkpA precursor (EC [uncultured Aureispira sp.]|uniref:peptidylprolyl isomerase n=1 Tax=uncultured Aureispira sp. TaxID=1331704 RepID=A0A6S6U4Y8_9BACT|nr:MAG: FKBP-type peptidyl-prolyl cis-trans isomerase FkpA precursor (EC [uncultured Aureispira sp.]